MIHNIDRGQKKLLNHIYQTIKAKIWSKIWIKTLSPDSAQYHINIIYGNPE